MDLTEADSEAGLNILMQLSEQISNPSTPQSGKFLFTLTFIL